MKNWPTFGKQEEVPEAFRSHYEEKDGKWVAKEADDDDGGTGALQTALEKERKLRKDAEDAGKLHQAEAKKAADALKAAELKKAGEKAGKTEDELKALTDKIRADLQAEMAAERTALQALADQVPGLNEKLQGVLLDSKVKERMLHLGVLPEKAEKMYQLERKHFKLTEDEKPMLAEHPGKTIDVFIQDNLKKEYPEWFKGTQGGGGGAGGHGFGKPKTGVTAEDVLRDPIGAIAAARAAQEGA